MQAIRELIARPSLDELETITTFLEELTQTVSGAPPDAPSPLLTSPREKIS